ncbi:tetratricopeptide repeat protein [Williamsia sterculiae]|uniref:Tetratrico peptide repeat-containing protein n=1 Tax=Williamsia sterculiae TaxID=1344003 RepID=A0A1N7H6R1_9NOCA|nr:tetratricopeptide repeat protein [Williamsia sterculiae]SIS20358.1 Tetratrico peptide repeat-containing protein [Williamsia sterculiae]
MTDTDRDLEHTLDDIVAARDRDDMQPTVDALERQLRLHPDNARVNYEMGGAHDTAGAEELALGFYERALDLGLDGDLRVRCLLQYGSTLRNLGRGAESLAVFDRAVDADPDLAALKVFRALTLHSMDRRDAALAELLLVIADHVPTADIARYTAAIRGNARYLSDLDG